MGLQGWNIVMLHHLWVEKNICELTSGKYHFVLFIYVNWKKIIREPTNVQYQLFSSPMWIKKVTCGPVIMQSLFLHHVCWKKQVKCNFLSSFIGVKKSLASSQGSNILSCLLLSYFGCDFLVVFNLIFDIGPLVGVFLGFMFNHL